MGLFFQPFSNILLLQAHEALLIDSAHIPKSQVLLLEVQQSLLSPLHEDLPNPLHAFSFAKIHGGRVTWMLPEWVAKAPRRGEGIFLILPHRVHHELEETETPRGRAAPSCLSEGIN